MDTTAGKITCVECGRDCGFMYYWIGGVGPLCGICFLRFNSPQYANSALRQAGLHVGAITTAVDFDTPLEFCTS